MASFAIARLRLSLAARVGAALLAATWPASAQAPLDDEHTSWHEKTAVDVEPSAESWIGAEGYRRVVSVYSGLTWAPFANLRQDGLRLRLVAGQGIYRYAGSRYDAWLDRSVWQQFVGASRFTDVMAGWQMSGGGTTVKAFAGFEWTSHTIAPYDPETQVQGRARGAKAAVEVWHNWSPKAWTSLDISVARPHAAYATQVRTGWRLDPTWSLGPEAAIIGHSETQQQRVGLFLRYEDLGHEFTVSSGVARARNDSPMSYLTGQYLRRF